MSRLASEVNVVTVVESAEDPEGANHPENPIFDAKLRLVGYRTTCQSHLWCRLYGTVSVFSVVDQFVTFGQSPLISGEIYCHL